jgi:hypothetical protein
LSKRKGRTILSSPSYYLLVYRSYDLADGAPNTIFIRTATGAVTVMSTVAVRLANVTVNVAVPAATEVTTALIPSAAGTTVNTDPSGTDHTGTPAGAEAGNVPAASAKNAKEADTSCVVSRLNVVMWFSPLKV